MLLHIARSTSRSIFLSRTYRLSARLETSPDELAAVRHHRLDRYEIFADPYRDDLIARAEAAKKRGDAVGWLVDTPQAVGTIWLELAREMTLLVRARMTFRITLGDLVSGVVVTNPSLNAIRSIEQVLIDSVDAIASTVADALAFQHQQEDVLAPGHPDPTTPPSDWTSSWS